MAKDGQIILENEKMDDIILRPWKILVLGMAGLINQEQQQIVEYLQMENKILKEIIG
jgi:hypothetical protein